MNGDDSEVSQKKRKIDSKKTFKNVNALFWYRQQDIWRIIP